ncbi:MAG TPA: magnesium transporter [Chthoniobacterales bacterium]|nr:magnesium transporter [Chthoniobacterales bacterium]
MASATHLERPVREYATQDFVQLHETMRIDEALQFIRDRRSIGQTLIYFYVVDAASRLTGVLQTRALLTAQPEERLLDIMIPRVIAIPETATVLEACEFFVLHKFLAFPIVDRERHITGVVDINLFNEEVFGIPKTENGDQLFQAIGFHISQARHASPLQVFRFRFPWLLVTIGAGTVCAFLARVHEKTFERTLIVAFFLTLVLALGESVAVQSLALALETLRLKKITPAWFLSACKREALTALPLTIAAGSVVFVVVLAVDGAFWPAAVISGSLTLGLGAACMLGISIPTLLHVAKLDLAIAAGPITLAATDIVTLLLYLSLTSTLL